MKEIIIRLGEGTIQTGFNSVNVELKAAGITQWEDRSNLPPNPELQQLLNEWQLLYPAAIELLSREINLSPVFDTHTVTNVSSQDLVELNQNFRVLINNWLNRSDFGNIVGRLRTDLDPRDRILVIIVGDRLNIWQLPWHLWNLFASYPGAVEVFCKPRFTNVTQVEIQRSNKVKILSLCGRDPNLQLDTDFLKTLPQAEIESLATTSAYELADRLTRSQPWQIFVFNGHGNTICTATTNEPDLQAGMIYLDNDSPIEIGKLKQSLRVAVDRGLQIAIFNCCSGLGLAAQLSDINLPYIIVMREVIPCSIAQQFLADILTEYSRGQSFPAAFQYARQRSILATGDFARFADWLPILFHNPLSRHVTWQDLTMPPLANTLPPQLVASCRYLNRSSRRPIASVGASLIATILAFQLTALPLISTLEQTISDRAQIAIMAQISPEPSVVKIINYEPFSSGNIINNDAELLEIVDRVERSSQPTAWGISLKIDPTTAPHPAIFDRANIIPECIDRAIRYSCDRPIFVNSLLTRYLASHSQTKPVARQLSWNSASLSQNLFVHLLTKIDRLNSSQVLELSPAKLKQQFDGNLVLIGIFDDKEPTTLPLAKTAIEIDRLIRAHHPQHPLPLFTAPSPGGRFLWIFLWSLLTGLALWRRQWWLWLAIALCGHISIAILLLICGQGLPLVTTAIAMMIVGTTIGAIKHIGVDPQLATVHNSFPPARSRT